MPGTLAAAITGQGNPMRVATGTVTGASGNAAVVEVAGASLTLPRLAWYPVTAGDTVNILVSDAGWLVLGPTGAVTGGGGGAAGPAGPAGRSVSSATVNGAGHLILSMSDSTTIDAGYVVGDDGAPGAAGTNGADGAPGVSVVGATINSSSHLVLTLSDGSTIDAGAVTGGSSTASDPGPRTAGVGPVRMSGAPVKFGRDAAYSAFPGAGRVPTTGRLVVAWRQGTDHVAARDGFIRSAYSDDDGRTWSTPITAVPNPGGGLDIRDADVGCSRDGTKTWLTYFKGSAANAALGCFLRTSTDGGANWGTESRIDGGAPYAALSGPLVEAPNGALVQPWYGRSGSETKDSVWVARSTNGGSSWTQTRVVNGPTAPGGGYDFQEPFIACCGTTLVMLYRWGNNDSIGITRSTDNGVTWSTPAVTFGPGTGRPAAVWLSTGVLVCVYRRNSDGAAVYRASRDLGATWLAARVSQLITRTGWMTYAAPVEVAPGLAFCTVGIESADGADSELWNSYIADGGGVSPLGDNFPDRVTRLAMDVDPIVAADDFDRADTNTGLGYALTGQPWLAGGRIEGGTARSATADFVPEYPLLDTRTPNVTVDADFLWTGDTGYAIMLRYRDLNNHHMFTVEGGGANVRFYVRNAGTYYILSEAGSVPVAAGQWRRLTAVIRGNRFLGLVDGQLALAYTIGDGDMTLVGAYTWHGLKFNESGAAVHRCRRFVVRA